MDKRLIAYAFLKDSYDKANGETIHAYRDMFETVLRRQSGCDFDTDLFVEEFKEIYGVLIPKRAAQGLLVYMRDMGLVTYEKDKGTVAQVLNFEGQPVSRDDPVIEVILSDLRSFCVSLNHNSDGIDERFFGWVRSLSFIDESYTNVDKSDSILFSLFVEHVKNKSEYKYSRLRDVMCGCLMAEAIETLGDKQDIRKFNGVEFYFDGPMLLDMFDLNSRDSTLYVKEIVETISHHGGKIATFEHCILEAEKVLSAVLRAYSDNPALVSGEIGLRVREKSAHISRVTSISGNLRKSLVEKNVCIVDAVSRENQAKFLLPFKKVKEDELFDDIGHAHSSVEGRMNDAKSIATIFRMRGFSSPTKMADAKAVFVTRNAQIAKVSMKWQKRALKNDDKCIAATFYDAGLAAYLWTHFGFDLEEMASRKLLASCATLLAPGSQMMEHLREILQDDAEYAEDYISLVVDREHAGFLTYLNP